MGIDESSARRRELGSELRRLREKAGFQGRDIAKALGWAQSKVSRVETGMRGSSELEAAIYLATCRVAPDELKRLLDLHAEIEDGVWVRRHNPRLPDELRSLVVQETTATAISSYEPLIVPGLAQTEDYTRAIFRGAGRFANDDIELRVRARMQRQYLTRRPHPPRLRFLIHEQALRLPVGGMRVMHDQLLHLVLLNSLPHWLVQVIPTRAGARTGAEGAFMLEYSGAKPTVYVELHTAGLFLEQPKDIAAYREILRRLAEAALNREQSTAALARLASEYDRPEEDPDGRT
ncbi:Helix-turn-helix domain-containing protein [Amycolatopsis marina]|uniref:Helix-turn-helix domain-containing protein n=1 Tax=Amycolatopsis marina TaxID=490629 RepID=A0A1I1BZA8_9PSEU|nr:helix-turn-helix transcriptional regulator [Amycolatopsis marina]SFB55735.1 Helix-turn-helix domain-containing protein [Amycolatopsis marina]